MISVDEALNLCLSQVRVNPAQSTPLMQALGRCLAKPVISEHSQPPFRSSAMDGYACCVQDVTPHAQLKVIATSAAGHPWDGTLNMGQAVRIFTGAAVPKGADCVVIQEDVELEGDYITLKDVNSEKTNIRPIGCDFSAGFALKSPRRLSASDLSLLAAMNHAHIPCTRKPKVAFIATGDELVEPGKPLHSGQIVASNGFALQAIAQNAGADTLHLPIAADTIESLQRSFDAAQAWGADIIVSIGGASVGDHDLLAQFVPTLGVKLAFHKIAMRPGKPLICGAASQFTYLGLPGNPASAIVCAQLFLGPMIRKMLGYSAPKPQYHQAALSCDLPSNGPRTHFMRANASLNNAQLHVKIATSQDSSLLTVLSDANCLLMRPPHAPACSAGQLVDILPLSQNFFETVRL